MPIILIDWILYLVNIKSLHYQSLYIEFELQIPNAMASLNGYDCLVVKAEYIFIIVVKRVVFKLSLPGKWPEHFL